MFFFFKQKTAYEMRISDWSSDVCSSDLYDGLRGTPTMLASNRGCGLIAAGSAAGAVRVWDARSGAVLMSGGHTQPVIDLRLNDVGSRLMRLTRNAVEVRSEERRVGKESVSTCISRVCPSF